MTFEMLGCQYLASIYIFEIHNSMVLKSAICSHTCQDRVHDPLRRKQKQKSNTDSPRPQRPFTSSNRAKRRWPASGPSPDGQTSHRTDQLTPPSDQTLCLCPGPMRQEKKGASIPAFVTTSATAFLTSPLALMTFSHGLYFRLFG